MVRSNSLCGQRKKKVYCLPPSPLFLPDPVPTIRHTSNPAPAMNTAATTATPESTNTTLNSTCYTHPVDYSGAGSPSNQESSHFLLLCLQGIAAFCLAASRRTIERIVLAYLQSTVNPTLCSLVAYLTATARGGRDVSTGAFASAEAAEEAQTLNDNESAVYQSGGARVNSKKVSWTYMRGAFSDGLTERGANCGCVQAFPSP